MTIEAHQKAMRLMNKIAHIDGILKFLNDLLASNTGSVYASIRNSDASFAAAEKVILDRTEINVVVKAFEAERANLEREFEAL